MEISATEDTEAENRNLIRNGSRDEAVDLFFSFVFLGFFHWVGQTRYFPLYLRVILNASCWAPLSNQFIRLPGYHILSLIHTFIDYRGLLESQRCY